MTLPLTHSFLDSSKARLSDQARRGRTGSCIEHAHAQWHYDPSIMIGCSAGITGTHIALSSLLVRASSSSVLPPASGPTQSSVLPASPLGPLLVSDAVNDMVIQEIDSLREQRPGMVQRAEQAALCTRYWLTSAHRSRRPLNYCIRASVSKDSLNIADYQ